MERAIKSTTFAKRHNVFDPFARHAILQKTSRGSAQNHFPMFTNVIRMRVTDEDPFRPSLRL